MRGQQHGEACKEIIRHFLKDIYAQINLLRQGPLHAFEIGKYLDTTAAIITKRHPAIYQELLGLAEGAGISFQDALVLQYRRELIHASSPDNLCECTTLAFHNEAGEPVIAQTVDLAGDMEDLGIILKTRGINADTPATLIYTQAGLLGYLGLNADGLGLGINMVISGSWGAGLSPYLLSNLFLKQRSVKRCLDIAKEYTRSSSRSFTLADRSTMVTLELTTNKERIINASGDVLTHTNHFLHEDLLQEDELPIFTKNASRIRLKRFNELALKHAAKLCPEQIFEIFADHERYPLSICAHNAGNIRIPRTIASVVMLPAKGMLMIKKGYPCGNNPVEKFIILDQ